MSYGGRPGHGHDRLGQDALAPKVLVSEAIRGPGATVISRSERRPQLLARSPSKPCAMAVPGHSIHARHSPPVRLHQWPDTATQPPPEVSARIRALMPSGGARRQRSLFEEYPSRSSNASPPCKPRWGNPGRWKGSIRSRSSVSISRQLLVAYLRIAAIMAAES